MSDTPQFTDLQLAAWRRYEKVRKGGKWNMYDPSARRATYLSAEDYSFVMHNYSKLKAAVEAKESKP